VTAVLDWNAGQWLVLAILMIGPIGSLVYNGKPLPDPKFSFSKAVYASAVMGGLLAYGGFWS
jgi:hypothetical protein